MRNFLLLFLLFNLSFYFAQITENFADGDFSNNPVWSGSSSLFLVDNGELRSNNPIASTYYLSTSSITATNAQWDFYVNLKFSTSGSNYVDVFLMSDNADLTLSQNGYFVRVGGTTDEVSLYELTNGSESLLIDGTDGIVNSSSNNPFNIRVKRTASNLWTLDTDDGATGNFLNQGSVTNNVHATSSSFGFKIIQSSAAGPINNHYFDNITVGAIVVDVTAPSLQAVTIINANQIDVLFNENLEQTSAENVSNYSVTPTNTINSATLDVVNKSLVHLTLNSALVNNVQNTLNAQNISDLNGNSSTLQSLNFTFVVPESVTYRDVIINEFICDPSPVVGLPEVEFIEIYNKSTKTIDLKKWKIGDNSSDGTIPDNQIILPGEYKVLCASTSVAFFTNAIAVTSFPSLNNTGDDIVIKDSNNVIIDKITYDMSWYQDEIKQDGGYSIELKNPASPCGSATNWSASMDPVGGTPGAQNSNIDLSPDTQIPSLVNLEAIAPNFLALTFSEKMDSLSIANSSFIVQPTLSVKTKFITESYPESILVEFFENFTSSQLYNIVLNNVKDCSQNEGNLAGEFSLSEAPVAGDLVINEILFNPVTNGSDFIEIKNVSNKIINLKNVNFANIEDDTIANFKPIEFTKNIKPNDYLVITPDSVIQKQTYPFAVPGKFLQMSLPTYNNDSGSVILIYDNKILDMVSYNEDWHFVLLDDNDGKSLEKINPSLASNEKSNWHTASEKGNFGTPGYENSQIMLGEANGIVSLTNPTFSPDNDGFEDILQINYQTLNPSMLATITIFDDRGRLIHQLTKNELIGTNGSITWDGALETKQKASIGTYVLVFDAFDLNGDKFMKKFAFVLAGK